MASIQTNTKTIGLVGGIASGKSLVAGMLRDLGGRVLDADRIGHEVLAVDADVRDAIRKRWGDEVLAADEEANRAAIARRVFAQGRAGEADRKFLEGLLHPRIRRRLESQHAALSAEGGPAIVLDAAVMMEAGWDALCDLVVLVDAPREVRLARARQRGWTEEDVSQREAAQWPVEEKRRRADVVIANVGSKEDLSRAVQAFWEQHVPPAAP